MRHLRFSREKSQFVNVQRHIMNKRQRNKNAWRMPNSFLFYNKILEKDKWWPKKDDSCFPFFLFLSIRPWGCPIWLHQERRHGPWCHTHSFKDWSFFDQFRVTKVCFASILDFWTIHGTRRVLLGNVYSTCSRWSISVSSWSCHHTEKESDENHRVHPWPLWLKSHFSLTCTVFCPLTSVLF